MFVIYPAQGGGFFWVLQAANGEKLCHSEVYTTKQSAQAGIAAVKRIAPTAQVVDRTKEEASIPAIKSQGCSFCLI